jgi:hypothetical protein
VSPPRTPCHVSPCHPATLQDSPWVAVARGAESGDFEYYDFGLFELEAADTRDPNKPFLLEFSVGVPTTGLFNVVVSMYAIPAPLPTVICAWRAAPPPSFLVALYSGPCLFEGDWGARNRVAARVRVNGPCPACPPVWNVGGRSRHLCLAAHLPWYVPACARMFPCVCP